MVLVGSKFSPCYIFDLYARYITSRYTGQNLSDVIWTALFENEVHTVYPKKYAHGFVVLCFVVVMQSFIMNSHEVFIHIHQGCFAGTGAVVRLPQCQWSKPDGYGKISQCITTTKHSKAKTVCIFLGIYCICKRVQQIFLLVFIGMLSTPHTYWCNSHFFSSMHSMFIVYKQTFAKRTVILGEGKQIKFT